MIVLIMHMIMYDYVMFLIIFSSPPKKVGVSTHSFISSNGRHETKHPMTFEQLY